MFNDDEDSYLKKKYVREVFNKWIIPMSYQGGYNFQSGERCINIFKFRYF